MKSVHVRHTAPGDWTADVTFGIPDDSAHDDPTITINSGEGLELPPKAGDILMVRPPEIVVEKRQGCAHCYGMGWVPSNTEADTDPCPKCWGSGHANANIHPPQP